MSSDTIMSYRPTILSVKTEGAVLKTWHQGNGPLLILIQGGGGTGNAFDKSISSLSRFYKVVAYDRRGNGASTVEKPMMLNPLESARDIVAIIKAMGYEKASLFGTSSGGILALQVAQSYPEHVDSMVIHEAPIVSILPGEHIKRVDSGYSVFQIYLEKGAQAALQVFRASVSGKEPEAVPSDVATDITSQTHRLDYFFRHEFLVFITYTPNLHMVKASKVPIATVEGVESKEAFHAVSARVQSEILGCHHVVWSGAHAPFMENPEHFATDLHKTLQSLHRGL
jgi:pimeloyl-ACP methyl ester carboxylesterase